MANEEESITRYPLDAMLSPLTIWQIIGWIAAGGLIFAALVVLGELGWQREQRLRRHEI